MLDFIGRSPYLDALQPRPAAQVLIRPATPADVQPILEMHERLSADTLYLRYLVPYRPVYLPAHVQEICSRPAGAGAALVAVSGGEVIGFGYYVVDAARPDTAEPALLIEDRYQGLGLGRRLFTQLLAAARKQGIAYFDAFAHSSNRRMLRLLRHSGREIDRTLDGGHVAVVLAL